MTTTLRYLAGAALATALASAPAQGAELTGTLKKIKETGTITIGHRDASIPFSYLDDQQQAIGYALDLCMRVVDAVKSGLAVARIILDPALPVKPGIVAIPSGCRSRLPIPKEPE